MKTSIDGLLSIISFEGVILKTYLDSAGVPTIGIGHTSMAGLPHPLPNMTIGLEDAVRLFQKDLEKYEKQVDDCIKIPLTQNEFDALVSWHFNTGGVVNSTLTDVLNKKDKAKAAKEFARWNKATVKGKKVVLRGLTRRRKRETDIFTKSAYGAEQISVDDGTPAGKRIWSKQEFSELLTKGQIAVSTHMPDPEEELSTEELLANPDSHLLPNFRPRQRDAVSRESIAKFAHLLPADRRNDAVILLGVRGYYTDTMGKKGVNDRGIYDDAIFVVTPDEIHNFNANTDSSIVHHGRAMLRSPQAVKYIPGLHGFKRKNGPYHAFRQASIVTVVRDVTGEDTDTTAKPFWINLHRGGNKTTSSRGCQTIPPNQWTEFKHLVDQLLAQYGQKDFYYLLIDEEDKAMAAEPVTTKSGVPVAGVSTEIAEIRLALASLSTKLEQLDTSLAAQPVIPIVAKAEQPSDTIASLQAILAAIDNSGGLKGKNTKEILGTVLSTLSGEPPLTPVNNALGPLVGKMLNGKKTILGTLGLLATTILPGLGVEAADGSILATAIKTVFPVATPILAALTGWGVLGKIDKYFATRT